MWGDGWSMWIWGALMMVIFWGGLAALVLYLVRVFGGRSGPRVGDPRPDEILAERFARGEISEKEFQHRKQVLEHRTP